jgi:hypothetical protein
MSEENGKKDTMSEELRAIRKVAKALEGMTSEQKLRVLGYIQASVYEEQRLSDQLIRIAQRDQADVPQAYRSQLTRVVP